MTPLAKGIPRWGVLASKGFAFGVEGNNDRLRTPQTTQQVVFLYGCDKDRIIGAMENYRYPNDSDGESCRKNHGKSKLHWVVSVFQQ